MTICNGCGEKCGDIIHIVENHYPEQGFPHDTEKILCDKCYAKFKKHITKQYKLFFQNKQ